MLREVYSVVINQTNGPGGVPSALIDIGYPRVTGQQTGPAATGTHIDKLIKSYNNAISIAVSEARKFQSLGVSVRAAVFGKVIDTGAGGSPFGTTVPPTPAAQQAAFTYANEPLAPVNRTPAQPAEYTLTAAELVEKLWADVDPLAHGLKQRINAANKTLLASLTLDPNETSDVDGAANVLITP